MILRVLSGRVKGLPSVCLVWPGHALGLFGLSQGLAWVCLVRPREANDCSIWLIRNFVSVRPEHPVRDSSTFCPYLFGSWTSSWEILEVKFKELFFLSAEFPTNFWTKSKWSNKSSSSPTTSSTASLTASIFFLDWENSMLIMKTVFSLKKIDYQLNFFVIWTLFPLKCSFLELCCCFIPTHPLSAQFDGKFTSSEFSFD